MRSLSKNQNSSRWRDEFFRGVGRVEKYKLNRKEKINSLFRVIAITTTVFTEMDLFL